MTPQGGGSIVMTSSNASLVAFPELLTYNISKSGVDMMVRTLAVEWGERNIRVNAFNPGYMDHIMSRSEGYERNPVVEDDDPAQHPDAPPRPRRRSGQRRHLPCLRRLVLHHGNRAAGRWRLVRIVAGSCMTQSVTSPTQTRVASIAVALCGAVWGVYWLPLRHLHELGLYSAWATTAFFVAALPPALLLGFLARHEIAAQFRTFLWLALLNGARLQPVFQRLCRHERLQRPVPVLPLADLEHPDRAFLVRRADRPGADRLRGRRPRRLGADAEQRWRLAPAAEPRGLDGALRPES